MKWLGAFMCITPITDHLVGAATSEAAGFSLIRQHVPDFLIVSDRLVSGSGMSLVRRTEMLNPDIKTLLVTDRESTDVIREALAYGCDGICFESEPFTPAFRVVARGGVYYPKPVAAALNKQTPASTLQFQASDLTAREIEILSYLILGLSNKNIGEKLYLSPETIKTHVGNIVAKMHARDRTHAAVLGLASGLVSLEIATREAGESLVAF